MALRAAGIDAPIVAWLWAPTEDVRTPIAAGAQICVSSREQLQRVIAAAGSAPATPDAHAGQVAIHVKVDTGMGRNGVLPADLALLLADIADAERDGSVRMVGIMSHLACADVPGDPSVDEQIHLFTAAIGQTERAGLNPRWRHLANTAATLTLPAARFNLVRCGIGLYGLSPLADRHGLMLAMTLRTQVALTKRVPAGQGVGYGLDYRTTADDTGPGSGRLRRRHPADSREPRRGSGIRPAAPDRWPGGDGSGRHRLRPRPGGRRPHNCESLLEYHRKRAIRAKQKGEAYELTPEQCAELQQEGIQYYHRYLSLFQINDFEGVVRDTQRNLDLFSFVNEHTDREDFSWGMQQFRPYVLMMNTRAKASMFLARENLPMPWRKLSTVAKRSWIFCRNRTFRNWSSKSAEIAFLDEWLDEVKAKRPLSKLEIMQREMETAIAKEFTSAPPSYATQSSCSKRKSGYKRSAQPSPD